MEKLLQTISGQLAELINLEKENSEKLSRLEKDVKSINSIRHSMEEIRRYTYND